MQVQNGLLNLIKLKTVTKPEFQVKTWTTNTLTSFWLGGTVSILPIQRFQQSWACVTFYCCNKRQYALQKFFCAKIKYNFFFSLGGVVLTHNLTLSARSGTTVPHQVASKTTAPTSPRLSLANQISFPSHVDGQAMLIGPQDQTGHKSGCRSMAGKRMMKLSLLIATFQC